MITERLSTPSRIIAVVCAVGLLAVLAVPIWRIELDAPQYPEGLVLKIHANRLAGDVDVINGLNHYIGMKTLHTGDFIEFRILPYIIGFLAILGILTSIIKRRWFLVVWAAFIVLFGIISMTDFYRWNYNYGHNLDPAAAIKVPGQSYQPPLIGYKQLLNFGAYSVPDTGGWIFIGVGVLIIFMMIREFRIIRKPSAQRHTGKTVCAAMFVLLLSSCKSGPKPIEAGRDECSFCKMTVSDTRYASELVTRKGKVYKFDDLHCLSAFTKSDALTDTMENKIYLVEFTTGEFVSPMNSRFLTSDSLKSPMGSNTAVFVNEDSLNYYRERTGGNVITWKQVIN